MMKDKELETRKLESFDFVTHKIFNALRKFYQAIKVIFQNLVSI